MSKIEKILTVDDIIWYEKLIAKDKNGNVGYCRRGYFRELVDFYSIEDVHGENYTMVRVQDLVPILVPYHKITPMNLNFAFKLFMQELIDSLEDTEFRTEQLTNLSITKGSSEYFNLICRSSFSTNVRYEVVLLTPKIVKILGKYKIDFQNLIDLNLATDKYE